MPAQPGTAPAPQERPVERPVERPAESDLSPAPAVGPSAGRAGQARRRARRLSPRLVGWLAPLAVALFALALRAWRLDEPAGVMFDEVYYARDAVDLLEHGVEVEDDGSGRFVVHPPLGKWLIAAGEALLGTTRAQVTAGADGGATGGEVGYRLAAVVAGTLTVLALARVARRMTGSTLLGCLAGLLLALDGLHLVQSRIAMLDVFLVGWVVAAFACLVADRDEARAAVPGGQDGRGVRWWRVAAGVSVGAALATKWSAAWPAAALGLLAVAWDVGRRRSSGPRPLRTAARRDVPGAVAAMALLPLVVYVVSWAGWFAGEEGWGRQAADGRYAGLPGPVSAPLEALTALASYHREMLDFHSGLSTPHEYASQPAQWLPLSHPVVYAYEGVPTGQSGCSVAEGCAREVLGVGTPALWWAGSLALVGVLWLWLSRRDWRAGAVLAMTAALLLPWFALPGRTMFLFYALPAVPFLVLGLVLLAGAALGPATASPRRRLAVALAVGAYVLLVAVNTAYLWPVLTAEIIPVTAWRERMWFPSWIL
jgi:dolichyl-phosphate-mannose-protein mannosyltransferase